MTYGLREFRILDYHNVQGIKYLGSDGLGKA